MSRLIFGCGYLGSRVAERWLARGEPVFVVTRSPERANAFRARGFTPIVADVLHPRDLAGLPAVETVLYAVGYDRTSGASVRDVYVGGLANVLDALPEATGRVIYVSSTGVYAQSQDEWVDEDSPCEPTRASAVACLAAEQLLLAHRLGDRAIVLRMAGLYGPGRIPNLDDLRHGRPIAAPQTGYLNLIHVDDAAAVVLAAAQRAVPPRTYVVSDGQPVERSAYYGELARLLGAPVPRFAQPAADSPQAVRAAASKRVNNARMQAELAVTLEYPTYRAALAAIVAAENPPAS